jgi:adenine/guanine phosphoribosyltransferase-like PRPP-binding protein
VLLEKGHHVTVVDDLLFGGESLLGYGADPKKLDSVVLCKG